MSELPQLIARLEKGISRDASYVKTIRHPRLLLSALRELDELTGNDKVKDSVATQVSHLIMLKRRAMDNPAVKEDEVMLNTVLYGPPGVGKTLVGSKLAKIWYSLGYLDNSNQKKHEVKDVLRDLFNESGTSSSSPDNTIFLVYIMVFVVVILVTVLSLTWQFYNRFGGYITLITIGVIIVLLVIMAIYVASILNDESSSAHSAKNSNNLKNSNVSSQDTPCSTGQCDEVKSNEECKNGECPREKAVNSYDEYMPPDSEIITVVTRADFVDKYVGWSDKKTIKLLEANLGKVLFVDEAYSLVTDMHDSFGMEVLTTMNLFISQHPKEIIIIFAGYKDLMETGIFSFQPGLRRRFMWQFDCNGYNEHQLFDIFKMQLGKKGWGLIDEDATRPLFVTYKDAFPAFGGDTERLTFFAELEHSRDFINNETGMVINGLAPQHVYRGILKLMENNIQDEDEVESNNPLANMMKMFRKKKEKKPTSSRNQVYSDQSEIDMLEEIKNSANDRAYY